MVEHAPYDQFTGTVIGNYRLDQLTERHPWGPIFRASSREGKSCVFRFIDTPLATATSDVTANARLVYLGRFQQEANRVAALQHPSILPLLDYGNLQGVPYLVYPALPLVSLRSLLAKNKPADPIMSGRFLEQIASALEHAHKQAVLHRNLSTGCIYLQDNQRMVVSEFGLKRMRDLSNEGAETPGKPYDGSSESCAPEQLLGKPIDTYTDIYALGAVLYRLLSGHPPFTGKRREEIAQQHLYAEVPPLRTWRPDLPTELDRVIARAMAKEPFQRFARPGEVTQAYYQIVEPGRLPMLELSAPAMSSAPLALAQEKTISRQYPSVQRAKPQVPDRSRRRVVTFIMGGVGLGVVGIAAAYGTHLLGGTPPSTAATGATAVQSKTSSGQATQPGGQSTKSPNQGAKVLARTADVPVNSAKTFVINNQKNPGIIIHLPNSQFVAFDSTCTHAGCAVDYSQQDKLLECPCHGATFDPAKGAAVIQGPAKTPLAPIKIVVNTDGTITAG